MIIKVDRVSYGEKNIIRAYTDQRIMMLNGKIIDFNIDEFVSRVLKMSESWPELMVDNSIFDITKYKVVIKENENKKVFNFYGKYPDNLHELNHLINEIVHPELMSLLAGRRETTSQKD